LKSIQLPEGLAKSIQQKLQAEQDAMRMVFILQREKLLKLLDQKMRKKYFLKT